MREPLASTVHVVIVVFSCSIHVSVPIAVLVTAVAAALRILWLHQQHALKVVNESEGDDETSAPLALKTDGPSAEAKPPRALHGARVAFTGIALGADAMAQDKKRMYYTLEVAPFDGGAPWTLHRSYRDFRALRSTLLATSLYFQHLSFPPRSPLGHAFVNHTKRSQGLLAFVTYIVQHEVLSQLPSVIAFFAVPEVAPLALYVPHPHERDGGDQDRLPNEQRAMVAQLQQQLDHDELFSCPIMLARHLQATSWSLPEAQARVQSIVAWRAANVPPSFDMDVLATELATGKLYVADFLAADNSALAIVKLYKENTWSAEHYVSNIKYTIEHGLRRVSPAHKMLVVIDFTNYSLTYCPDMSAFQDFVHMVEKYYIEHLGAIYLVDLPWLYAKMLHMIKPLLNATTRSKLTMVKSSNLKSLAAVLSTTDLLRHVGPAPTFELDVATYLKPF
ncbi:hypothetical protein SDRG_06760 [Saprolegnia diclina VS20]|uniref:CRAL-TRIO domain-containing protein n=1 Tax=Saprolegnia diclina (strain VS20) TaxID=1156394 RepID=T0S099_SAPDV|nr:hypothetical protein SDRG_06760 [Saprolegnia diclina VS20]EQC36022.1 hypothetical protein SDRG_06760 [Saprolegnia diclina VS20]|eukprot:XP_008610784.1 hypothetical protein SDRG_06760 [Saprolegnia diclina VS20]